MNPVVYIRATDLRPFYIKHEGKYFLVQAHLSSDKKTRIDTRYVRLGDFIEIGQSRRRLHLPVHFTTVFTDQPNLKGCDYA